MRQTDGLREADMGVFEKEKKRSEVEAHESDAVQKKNRGGIYRLAENRPGIIWGIAGSLLGAYLFLSRNHISDPTKPH